MLLESWRAMTTPPNWEYSDFIKALEKRNIDLSNTEKETLKFVFGELQTPPDNVERTIESFNKNPKRTNFHERRETPSTQETNIRNLFRTIYRFHLPAYQYPLDHQAYTLPRQETDRN